MSNCRHFRLSRLARTLVTQQRFSDWGFDQAAWEWPDAPR